jgi:actin-related protein 6
MLAAALPLSVHGLFDCRPAGPIVPRPTGLASNPAFLSAASDLTEILQNAVSGEIEAGWPVENTSFSVGFITRDQEDKKVPVWEYHFLAPNNVRGTKNITRNSQYNINSITKVISDYILLRSGVPLDDPVTKYIPELATNSTQFDWDAITLRHLGSSLAGIPPSCKWNRLLDLTVMRQS